LLSFTFNLYRYTEEEEAEEEAEARVAAMPRGGGSLRMASGNTSTTGAKC
jgi:hypothetical protein